MCPHITCTYVHHVDACKHTYIFTSMYMHLQFIVIGYANRAWAIGVTSVMILDWIYVLVMLVLQALEPSAT